MSKKGKNITIKGVLYEDGSIETSKPSKKKLSGLEEKGGEAVATEVASQTASTGIQAVVATVQTQAANLGASGLIAVGSAGGMGVDKMHDNYWEAYETAAPMVAELVETGTISQETIAVSLPPDSKFQGKELKPVGKVLGVKVGEERKQAIKEKEEKREAKEQAKQEKARAKEVAKAEKQVAKEQAKQEKIEEKAKEEEAKEIEEKIENITKQIQQSATGKDTNERDGSLY